ncbi:MAG: hypothetical protein ABJM29_20700 [Rhizobiaceae bacterium]
MIDSTSGRLVFNVKIDLSYLEDCQRARPEWAPGDGVTSSLSEFTFLINTPLGYAWIAIVLLCLRQRSILSGIILIFVSLALLANWILQYNLNDDLYLGGKGGCVGSLSATFAVLLAVSLIGAIVVGVRLNIWSKTNR